MTDRQIVAMDFGSENIRLARSTQNIYAPQILRPVLLNAIRIDRNEGMSAIGASVYDGVKTGALITGVSLFDDKLGPGMLQGLQAVLREAHRMLDLGRLSAEQKPGYETVFSLPIGCSSVAEKVASTRLLENGFPAPRAVHAAKAILSCSLPDIGFRPGRYLILDCGASHARMVLSELDSSRNLVGLVENVSAVAGGKELDMILLEHFLARLDDCHVNRAEFLDFVRQFKIGFVNQIRQGMVNHAVRSPFPCGIPSFDLNFADFQEWSRAYFEMFESAVAAFLHAHDTKPSDLEGVLLAGGNTLWPSIRDLVERLAGRNSIVPNEFPEDAIVRGLALSIAVPKLFLTERSDGTRTTSGAGSRSDTVKPFRQPSAIQPQNQAASFPLWLAMVLEFFPGMAGILGLGWLVGTHTVFGLPWWPGILTMLAWPLLLILLLVVLVGSSLHFTNLATLILFFPVWLGVPCVSGLLAFWVAKSRRRSENG